VADKHIPQAAATVFPGAESWELQAVGDHGIPVLERIEQFKQSARRLAGRNEPRCFLFLFEERLLNDLIVDMTSAYLDLERVAGQMRNGQYRVGATDTDLYRVIVH
jgi:hypothetical protein